jgi:hypothetical protein
VADDTATQNANAVGDVAPKIENLEPAAQLAAVSSVIKAPDAGTTSALWLILISGLVAVMLIALGGLIYLIAEEIDGSDVILTVFSSVLTGLIGLFSPRPGNPGG